MRQFHLAKQLSQMKESQQKKVFTDATEEENDKEEKTEQTTKIEEQCKVIIKRNSSLNLAEPACVVGSTSSLWEGQKRETQIGIRMYFVCITLPSPLYRGEGHRRGYKRDIVTFLRDYQVCLCVCVGIVGN